MRLNLRPAEMRGRPRFYFLASENRGLSAIFLLYSPALWRCSRPARVRWVFHHEAYVFGTRVDVAVYGENQAETDRAAAAVLREVRPPASRLPPRLGPSRLTALNAAIARAANPHRVRQARRDAGRTRRDRRHRRQAVRPCAQRPGRAVGLPRRTPSSTPRPCQTAGLLANRRWPTSSSTATGIEATNPAVQLDLGSYAKGAARSTARRRSCRAGRMPTRSSTSAATSLGARRPALADRHPASARAAPLIPCCFVRRRGDRHLGRLALRARRRALRHSTRAPASPRMAQSLAV